MIDNSYDIVARPIARHLIASPRSNTHHHGHHRQWMSAAEFDCAIVDHRSDSSINVCSSIGSKEMAELPEVVSVLDIIS